MNTKKYKRSVFCVAFLVVLAIMLTQVTALAAQPRTVQLRLTIESAYDGTPISNEQFELYEFAHYSDKGDIIIDDEFKDYNVDFDNMTEENWQDLAEIATAYALRDSEPECAGATDENGIVVFEEADTNLTDAIYLIVGETVDKDDLRYTCEPFFISMPGTENGDYIYDQVAIPKLSVTPVPASSEIKAVKIWDDNDSANRPKSIDVQLLKNGEVYDTQTLSKENNWRYTWEHLDAKFEYTVVESEVPSGYTVSLDITDQTYTLTNTAKPTTTTTNTNTTNTTTQTNSKLPKTGLNWLPVPLLLIAGVMLVVAGFITNKNGGNKYEG